MQRTVDEKALATQQQQHNNEEEATCFVCGAGKATWAINSKAVDKATPFFPFLAFHDNTDCGRLDVDGRGRACNVCHSFLVQQWNTYEASQTPIMKRVYWLKRLNASLHDLDEYNTEQEETTVTSAAWDTERWQETAASRATRSHNRNDVASPITRTSREISKNDNSNTDRPMRTFKQENADEENEHSDGQTIHGNISEKGRKPAHHQGQETDGDLWMSSRCYVCERTSDPEALVAVHTRPQLNPEMPFFPCLSRPAQQPPPTPSSSSSRANKAIGHRMTEQQGKARVCVHCHDSLYQQWKRFQQDQVPLADRDYDTMMDTKRTSTNKKQCSICKEFFVKDQGEVLQCRDTGTQYYPFIINLLEKDNDAVEWRGQSGASTRVCAPCAETLLSYWEMFERQAVPQQDRVYARVKDTKNHSTCYCCNRQTSELKPISTSPYANAYFAKINVKGRGDGVFPTREVCAGKGATLRACHRCYEHLHRQAVQFDEQRVPRHRREFILNDGGSAGCLSVACRLCQAKLEQTQAHWLHIRPPAADAEITAEGTLPFFPFLAKHVFPDARILCCSLCFSNLHSQWMDYESSNERAIVSPWERTYTVSQFVCYSCACVVHRNNVTAVDLDDHPLHVKTAKPRRAVNIGKFAVICSKCKQRSTDNSSSGLDKRPTAISRGEPIKMSTTSGQADNLPASKTKEKPAQDFQHSIDRLTGVVIGMKATATVPPLNTSSSSPAVVSSVRGGHPMIDRGQTGANHDDSNTTEGSFAAALRKLARDALVTPDHIPAGSQADRKPMHLTSPPANMNAGRNVPGHHHGPSPSHHHHGGFSHTGGTHRPNYPPSVVSNVGQMEFERPDVGAVYPPHIVKSESPSRRHAKQPMMAPYARHEGSNSTQDDQGSIGGHPKDFPISRDHGDRERMGRSSHSVFAQASTKDRNPSNIGLVHPQRIRKMNSDEGKSPMSAMQSRDSQAPSSGLFRPQSPNEPSARYPPTMAAQHSHGAGSTCPVHGGEPGHHRHGSPNDPHQSRSSARLPYDAMGLPSLHQQPSSMADLHAIRPQHHRLQEDLFALPRHPPVDGAVRGKDTFPVHAIDDDMRRRGFDWPWSPSPAMPHPYYDAQQYRRQLIGSLRGHEHSYKDLAHNQMYFTHPLYMPPRDYPPPVDPYLHPGLMPADLYHHRHEPPLPPVSPQLLDYYRRAEHHQDRTRDLIMASEYNGQAAAADRYGMRPADKPKPTAYDNEARRSRDHVELQSPHESEASARERRKTHNHDKSESPDDHHRAHHHMASSGEPISQEKDAYIHNLGLVSHQIPQRPSLIHSSVRTLKQHSVANENKEPMLGLHGPTLPFPADTLPIAQRTTSPTDTDPLPLPGVHCSAVASTMSLEEATTDGDEKVSFMFAIGLVLPDQRRVMEEEYEKKRWERKFRKFRGRPKKKLKKEMSEDSESRCGNADMDFYSGPITRHKQQLMQEQETLLGQVQRPDKEQDVATNSSSERTGSDTDNISVHNDDHYVDRSLSPLSSSGKHRPSIYSGEHAATTTTGRTSLKRLRAREGGKPHSHMMSPTKRRDANVSLCRDNHYDNPAVLESNLSATGGSRLAWPGIDIIAQSYATYKGGLEREEEALRRNCDKLRSNEEDLKRQSSFVKRDMMCLHDKKLQLGESLQKQRRDIDYLHNMLHLLAASPAS